MNSDTTSSLLYKKSTAYRYCAVPKCKNTKYRTPDKEFISIPQNPSRRIAWCEAMNRPFLNSTTKHVCQDHFDLENDMANYVKWKLVGCPLKPKNDVVPHIFKHNEEENRRPTILHRIRKTEEIPENEDEKHILVEYELGDEKDPLAEETEEEEDTVNAIKDDIDVGNVVLESNETTPQKADEDDMKMTQVGDMGLSQSPITFEKPEDRIDWDSVQGKFGWTQINHFNIPYISRSGVKFTAIRIAEEKLLSQFKTLCNSEVYSCFLIKQFYLTDAEARLLNEINMFHCNALYGNFPFTESEKMLKLEDVQHLYDLFSFIRSSMDDKIDLDKSPCGFIKMDDQPPVPYVVVKGQKYSPMFYFEGASEYLEDHAIEVTEWDLSYLKFCCKIQGIRQEFYADDKCKVVEFEDIKKFLPPETKFTFMWPKNSVRVFFSRLESEKAKDKKNQQNQQSAISNHYSSHKAITPSSYLNAYNNYLSQPMYNTSQMTYSQLGTQNYVMHQNR